jgi:hypothetical protein
VFIITHIILIFYFLFYFFGEHASEWQEDVRKKLFKITDLMKSTYLTVTMTDNATLHRKLGIRM